MGKDATKNNNWIRKNRERISLVIETGTKEEIRSVLMQGESVNSFISGLVLAEINARKERKKAIELKRYTIQPERQQEPPNDPVDNDMLKLANLGVKKGFSDDFMDIPDGIIEDDTSYEKLPDDFYGA